MLKKLFTPFKDGGNSGKIVLIGTGELKLRDECETTGRSHLYSRCAFWVPFFALKKGQPNIGGNTQLNIDEWSCRAIPDTVFFILILLDRQKYAKPPGCECFTAGTNESRHKFNGPISSFADKSCFIPE